MHRSAHGLVFFKNDDVVPALGEHSRRRGAGGSGPNHDYIAHVWLLAVVTSTTASASRTGTPAAETFGAGGCRISAAGRTTDRADRPASHRVRETFAEWRARPAAAALAATHGR